MKKVSIIITCYNKGEYVKEAVESALNQTYQNLEIVCVDDYSKDNSYETLKDFADRYKNIILFRNEENRGVIYSRNSAIDRASGEYILPLDADDTIEPTYVEKAVKILDEHPEIGVVYCKADFIGERQGIWNLPDFDKDEILFANCIFCTALFRKSDFIKAGKYKEYMNEGLEDYDLWLSFVERGFQVYKLDEVLFNYRQCKEDTRTSTYEKNEKKVWQKLFKNHIDMYLDNNQFWDRLHLSPKILEEKQNKYKKYKKLFNLLLPLVIIEFITIIIIGVIICF